MSASRKQSRTEQTSEKHLISGEIIEVSFESILFSQKFCRCFLPDCCCPALEKWIPKSVLTRSALYEPKFRTDIVLWEKGTFSLLIERWYWAKHLNPLAWAAV